MKPAASPGHKLGQMIGNFFQAVIAANLEVVAAKHGLYLDRQGPRPGVRGDKKKVTWEDSGGNRHDLDYVLERGGSSDVIGRPVAFVELAWRRYTKHSRNKTGEIEGALLHLCERYRSCAFAGVILAGEYTQGGIEQLQSHGINVLHLPYAAIIETFRTKGIDLDYAEGAPASDKQRLVSAWQRLSKEDLTELAVAFEQKVRPRLDEFVLALEASITRRIQSVSVLSLYGRMATVTTISQAMAALEEFKPHDLAGLKFECFEIIVRMHDGSEITGRGFPGRKEARRFLEQFGMD